LWIRNFKFLRLNSVSDGVALADKEKKQVYAVRRSIASEFDANYKFIKDLGLTDEKEYNYIKSYYCQKKIHQRYIRNAAYPAELIHAAFSRERLQ
jgi:hypothetical protein